MSPGEPLNPDARERLRSALESRPDVLFAYLFGSRAGGLPHAESDVDVAVYLEEDPDEDGEPKTGANRDEADGRGEFPSAGRWAEVHGDLVGALRPEERGGFGRDRGGAPEGVDLVLLNGAPPLLAERVVRTGRILFSRDESERLRWVTLTKARYCDLRFLRERLDRTVSERIRRGRFGRRPAEDAHGPGEGEGA